MNCSTRLWRSSSMFLSPRLWYSDRATSLNEPNGIGRAKRAEIIAMNLSSKYIRSPMARVLWIDLKKFELMKVDGVNSQTTRVTSAATSTSLSKSETWSFSKLSKSGTASLLTCRPAQLSGNLKNKLIISRQTFWIYIKPDDVVMLPDNMVLEISVDILHSVPAAMNATNAIKYFAI